MRVLVTGGAGFIGSWLCNFLLEKGYKVFCLDSLITGRKDNITHLLTHEKFTFIRHDVRKKIGIRADYIFHLASPASPASYMEYSIETSLTNSIGTYMMLELARKNKARFLLASTSEVYGDPLEHPQRETYWGNVNPLGVRACYDESKRFAESLTMSFHRKYGLGVRIARIFNTFGPRMRSDDGRVIPNFIVQALSGKDITVYGDGKQTRSFCYVSDMVDGLMKLMFTEGIDGEAVNLGNPDERTIIEVARIVKRLTNSESRIVFKPLPPDDPTRRRPDITKARRLLNWEPKTDFEDGIKRTIDWFSDKLRS